MATPETAPQFIGKKAAETQPYSLKICGEGRETIMLTRLSFKHLDDSTELLSLRPT